MLPAMRRILYPTILFVILELAVIYALVMWTVRWALARHEYEALGRIARRTVSEITATPSGTATLVMGIILFAIIMAGSTLLFVGWLRERSLHRKRTIFFASISHELMTPLTSFQLNTELLLKNDEDPKLTREQARQLLVDMRSQSLRLGRRLRNIIQTTRLENRRLTLEPESVDAVDFLRHFCSRSSRVNPGADIVFSCVPDATAPAMIDASYMEIVLENLLENAIKYGATELVFSVQQKTGQVDISISDNGAGIEPKDLNKIFSLFYRASEKTRGTGLGLSVARQLVKLHKGRIRAHSDGKDRGTTFIIELPAGQVES